MKNFLTLLLVLFITGCATHAKIQMKGMAPLPSDKFTGKSFYSEIYYSQPKPGIFSGGEEMPMKPLSEAELSVMSSSVLNRFNNYVERQLPAGASIGSSKAHDYKLKVELTAFHKMGPAYYDYELMKSFALNMLTLGIAPDEYNLIADFNITYTLIDAQGTSLLSKSYQVDDFLDHEMSGFENYNLLNELSQQLVTSQ